MFNYRRVRHERAAGLPKTLPEYTAGVPLAWLRLDDQACAIARADRAGAQLVGSALTPTLGRAAAQSCVREAVLRAAESGERLRDTLDVALLERAGSDDAALAALLDPRNDLGSAGAFIERALCEHDKLRQGQ